MSQTDPQQTVQTFIDLIQRHEQSFYHFVHKVHSKGESLFNDLMRWIELFLAVIREGLGAPVSLEFLLPHTGPERAAVLAEVDAVALYHYKLKIAYESKIRRRFAGGAEGGGGAGAEDEAAQALMQGVLRDLSYGELMRGDAEDAAAEDTDESGEGSTEYETDEEDEEEDEDEDGSSEEDWSGSEGAARAKALARSRTTPHAPHTPQSAGRQRPQQQQQQQPPPPQAQPLPRKGSRPRLLSLPLRKSRSMTFGDAARRSAELPPPPVPPLPKHIPLSARSKPLPPSPGAAAAPALPSASSAHSHHERSGPGPYSAREPPPSPSPSLNPLPTPTPTTPRREDRRSRRYSGHSTPSASARTRKQKQKRQQADALKPPDLQRVPDLLPIFLEMVRGSHRSFSARARTEVLTTEPVAPLQMRPQLRPRGTR